jgi:hypothetical protein
MTDDDYIDYALSQSPVGRDMLLADMARLESGIGRITVPEYVDFGLYDWDLHSEQDRQRFISDRLHWPIVAQTCNLGWHAATEDKWIMETILRQAGVDTPPILAVLDTGIRLYPGTFVIRTEEDLRNFLVSNAGRPFFGKKLTGIASAGIFCCIASDRDAVSLLHEGTVPTQVLFDRLKSEKYVFQPVVRNHPFFADIASNLCTIRLAAFVYDDILRVAFAFMKIPQGENLTDLFKPAGNLALGLVPSTGKITSVRQRLSIGTRLLGETTALGARLLDKQLPFWPEVLAAAARVALVFAPVRYQSMDIALTESGPVVIEVNMGAGFAGPQLVYGRGLLQPNVLHFFDQAGVVLDEIGRHLA